MFLIISTYFRLTISRSSSPSHNITEVPKTIRTQSLSGKGTTLNISPPKVTINICPRAMINKVTPKPRLTSLSNRPFNADCPVW